MTSYVSPVKRVPVENWKPRTDDRPNCQGCCFYRPGRPRRQWCINGGWHTPEECKRSRTIFVEREPAEVEAA